MRSFIYLLPGLALSLCGSSAWALSEYSGGVRSQVIFSDNICSSRDDPEFETIGVLTPYVDYLKQGRRFNLDLSAALETNTLDYDRIGCTSNAIRGLPYTNDNVVPRLNAQADAVLLNKWFYMDAGANIHQVSVNPFNETNGADNISSSSNRSTLYNYYASPYLYHRWGNTAHFSARYTYDEQHNSAFELSDSSSEEVELMLGTVEDAYRFGVTVIARDQQVEYDTTFMGLSRDSEMSSVELIVTYDLFPTLQLVGIGGVSDNDFIAARSDIDGEYWNAGFRFSPQSRTFIEFLMGERFFGHAYTFNFRHRLRRGIFTASYNRTVSFDRDLRANSGFNGVLDENGFLVDPVTGNLLPLDGTPTTVTTSPMLHERANLAYTITGRRSTLAFAVNYSDQTRFVDEGENRFYSASASFRRQLTSLTSVLARLNWRDYKRVDEGSQQVLAAYRDQRLSIGTLGVTRRVSHRMDASVTYTYTHRSGDNNSLDYAENRVTLGLDYRFK